jgi:hypothetical protein
VLDVSLAKNLGTIWYLQEIAGTTACELARVVKRYGLTAQIDGLPDDL